MAMKKINIGIIGVSGFARAHLDAFEVTAGMGLSELKAAVILDSVKARDAETEAALRQKGVAIYRTAAEMFAGEKDRIDLTAIPTGIAFHAPLSIQALEAGYHVYCEKPAAGTVAETEAMRAAVRQSEKQLIIGYQNLFTESVGHIKKTVLSGELGRLLAAKTMVLWPRSSTYYARNHWAGRIAVKGQKIYDSPAHNAASHFLMNMLYCAGPSSGCSLTPVEVYAENFRAQNIESADTQYIRVTGGGEGPVIFMYATHACETSCIPITHYRFEYGRVEWNGNGETVVFDRQDNVLRRVSNSEGHIHHLCFISAFRALLAGETPISTISNTWQQVAVINQAFEENGPVQQVTANHVKDVIDTNGAVNATIVGLEKDMRQAFEAEKGFREAGLVWAREK